MEHGQEENLSNAERMRNDLHDLSCKVALRSELYELTCKVARMAQTMEDMQDKQYAREKAQTYEKASTQAVTKLKENAGEGTDTADGKNGDKSRRKTG